MVYYSNLTKESKGIIENLLRDSKVCNITCKPVLFTSKTINTDELTEMFDKDLVKVNKWFKYWKQRGLLSLYDQNSFIFHQQTIKKIYRIKKMVGEIAILN